MNHRKVRPTRCPGVLLVDPACIADDAFVRGLEVHGWAVWLAADTGSAIATYALHADEIDVAVVDFQQPGLEGLRVLADLRAMDPELSCCAITSAACPYVVASFRKMCDTPLFTKPLDPCSLSFTLFEMIAPIGKRASLVTA